MGRTSDQLAPLPRHTRRSTPPVTRLAVVAALAMVAMLGFPAAANASVPRRAITDIQVISGSSSDISCPSGYSKVPQDLNEGAGGDYQYLCLKYEWYPWASGTRGLSYLQLLVYTWPFQGIRHHECPDKTEGAVTQRLIDVDLNQDAGGNYVYLCAQYTTLPHEKTQLGGFIYDLGFITSDGPMLGNPATDPWPKRDACKAKYGGAATYDPTGDFNSLAGGKYIWGCEIKAGGLDFADQTPPQITPVVTGKMGSNGWYVSDVHLHWQVSDPQSDITSRSGCEDTTVDTDTTGTRFVCTATSEGGTTRQAVTLRRDATPPTLTATRTPPANSAGWNNTDVTVSFTCTDATSGVASCPTGRTFSSEGAGQSMTATATDEAGNTATVTVGDIDIDKTPPKVDCATSPTRLWPANHKLVPVTTDVSVGDGLSGPGGFRLVGVTSSEPDNGRGDGNTTGDIAGFAPGTADATGQLRAERSGHGHGRTYTLTYQGSDLAGNRTTCRTTVVVPHHGG